MRKITTIMLTLALCLVGVSGAKAEKLQSDFSEITGTADQATWNSETRVLTWQANWSNSSNYFMIKGLTATDGHYDLSSWKTINITISALSENTKGIRIRMKNSSGDGDWILLNGAKTHTINLSDFKKGGAAMDLSAIDGIQISGGDGSQNTDVSGTNKASATFTELYLEGYYIEANPGDETPINEMTSYHKSGDEYVTTGYTPNYRINQDTNAAYFGVDWSGENCQNYTDVSGYTSIRVYQAASTPTVRSCFFNADASGQQQFYFTWNAAGYYELDLATVQATVNNLKLISIRPQSGQTSSVTRMVVVKPSDIDYVLSGNGTMSASATAALADANASLIDATGVTGTGVTLTSANPNCIFKANSGVLANTKNVMVGTTIANLDLTDGHPFAAPAGAKATAATYSRTMTNQFGTICLPYAVSSDENVKYYTLGALSGDVLTLTAVDNLAAGTPAIVEKVSGSSITAAGSGALVGVQVPGAGALQLFGTFEAKTILASDYAGKSIYAIANNQFVQATNSINLPAFRAFFVSTPASANIRFGFDEGEDATAINALSGEGDVTIESIYSADGAQQSSLQKGMNVVKMSNGEVKKILVK